MREDDLWLGSKEKAVGTLMVIKGFDAEAITD
jgi:hypothetical protein